ncbi:MAG: hypothetical protein U0974_01680 [Gemmatimonadales bacterium]|nr:hypothetical protein [Gemmatimonadales bacterium]MDZ4388427.1 hypothetical protein [Gemmatimonadales bacterium]
MQKTLGLGALVVVAAALLVTTFPKQSFAAETLGGSKCGERLNPTDESGVTEHRYQEDGICVTGGDYHTDWWVGNCVPQNHKSGPCPS